MLAISALNVVSSPGFKRCLPKDFPYLLSHNVNPKIFDHPNDNILKRCKDDKIVVLTIGAIRDFESNKEVIDALGNDDRFDVRFVGRGPSEEDLKKYVKEMKYSNVTFSGFYKKEDESKYIAEADFLNIFYPRKLSHDTALSNRFYNSIFFCKPMITTKDTIQGDYAKKFCLGVAVADCSNLPNDLLSFYNTRCQDYMNNRNIVLKTIQKECYQFEEAVRKFIHQV